MWEEIENFHPDQLAGKSLELSKITYLLRFFFQAFAIEKLFYPLNKWNRKKSKNSADVNITWDNFGRIYFKSKFMQKMA